MLTCKNIKLHNLETLLCRYQLRLISLDHDCEIIGSYWGEPEAGPKSSTLYMRADTPVHSTLHEASHYICTPAERRLCLDTNAGGSYDEENGVCFLQILLSDYIPEMGRSRMMKDMDEWGYTFRLGSAEAWFYRDAQDALEWLQQHGLIDFGCALTWKLRNL